MGLDDFLKKYEKVEATQGKLLVDTEPAGLEKIYVMWLNHKLPIDKIRNYDVSSEDITTFIMRLPKYEAEDKCRYVRIFFNEALQQSYNQGHNDFFLPLFMLKEQISCLVYKIYATTDNPMRIKIKGNTGTSSVCYSSNLDVELVGSALGSIATKLDSSSLFIKGSVPHGSAFQVENSKLVFYDSVGATCGLDARNSEFLFYGPTKGMTGYKAMDSSFVFLDQSSGSYFSKSLNCDIYYVNKVSLERTKHWTHASNRLYLVKEHIDFDKVEIKDLMNHPGVERWD